MSTTLNKTKNPNNLYVGCEGDLWNSDTWDTIRPNYSKTHRVIESVADLKATLRAGPHAWPGGYPLHLVTFDGEAMSFESALENFSEIVDDMKHDFGGQWKIIGCDVNWENDDLYCCYSGKQIESAYGDNS